jgi:hypothetical protein
VRVPLRGGGEADELEELLHALAPLDPALAADAEAEVDVVSGGHVREERVGLEDHAHVAVVRRHVREVIALDHHPARGWPLEAGDDAKRRRLPAAGRAEQREELARLDGDVDLLDRREVAKLLVELFQFQIGHQRVPPTCTVVRPGRLPTRRIPSSASQVIPKEMIVSAAAGLALVWPM